jgi:hypothetical protein
MTKQRVIVDKNQGTYAIGRAMFGSEHATIIKKKIFHATGEACCGVSPESGVECCVIISSAGMIGTLP